MPLNSKNTAALNSVAKKLGVSPKKLYMLILFESGFNPLIKNRISGAAGLIQFMPKTARDLGYKDENDLIHKHPTIKSQLETPVYNYLKIYKPFFGDQSLFMSVFYPKARYWPFFFRFPKRVRRDNPGIVTVGDYMKKVYRRSKLTYIPPLLILIGITGAIYYYTRRVVKHGKKIEQGRESEETDTE